MATEAKLWELKTEELLTNVYKTYGNQYFLCRDKADFNFWLNLFKLKLPDLPINLDSPTIYPCHLIMNIDTSENHKGCTYHPNYYVRHADIVPYPYKGIRNLRISYNYSFAPPLDIDKISISDNDVEQYKHKLLNL